MSAPHSYYVRPRHDARHGHLVEAESFEDAAVAFVERWSPPVDAEGVVSLLVRDREDGRELCFTLDLDDVDGGDAAPCG